jgi:acylphosphatase
MLLKADIRFRKLSSDDGFGFTCLKAAYHFGIKGRMDYSAQEGVAIHAEGDSKNIREFLHWIEGQAFDFQGLKYTHSPSDRHLFKEFDLYKHFD